MTTLDLMANALSDSKIKVNAVNPGWVQTSIGSDQAPLTPEEGAKSGVEMALIDEMVQQELFLNQAKFYLGNY